MLCPLAIGGATVGAARPDIGFRRHVLPALAVNRQIELRGEEIAENLAVDAARIGHEKQIRFASRFAAAGENDFVRRLKKNPGTGFQAAREGVGQALRGEENAVIVLAFPDREHVRVRNDPHRMDDAFSTPGDEVVDTLQPDDMSRVRAPIPKLEGDEAHPVSERPELASHRTGEMQVPHVAKVGFVDKDGDEDVQTTGAEPG